MIETRCLAPDVDPARIDPTAQVSGDSYLSGPETSVGPGATIRNSRLHNVRVEAHAAVVDSIVKAEGRVASHRCDAAGRTVVSGSHRPRIGPSARVSGATLLNTDIGPRSEVTDAWAENCRFGEDNRIRRAKATLVNTAARVRLDGPTEVSEAYLGHDATLDRCGYFEGVFSNRFLQVRFDRTERRLRVVGQIDLPHVSRYGVHAIHSTNSGRLLPQSEGVLHDFGPHGGLWSDPLLSHEQVELGPCCWVAPWTKVIGRSNSPHASDDELVADRQTTYLMPLAMAGVGGESTQGLVMPGELSNGRQPKQRRGAWVFTYAPGAVFAMVARLYEALEVSRKNVADTIVDEALRTALAMVEAMAAEHGMDVISSTYALLTAHLESGLWRFENGRPLGWRRDESGCWTHPAMGRILALAPDALEKQVDESDLFEGPDAVPAAVNRVAIPSGQLDETIGSREIDPTAMIDPTAWIGPGCRIGPGTVVGPGASVWRSVLDGCTVDANAQIERSVVHGGRIGERTIVRSSRLDRSSVGPDSTVNAAELSESDLAGRATVAPFAQLERVRSDHGLIVSGPMVCSRLGTNFMSMHAVGRCEHLEALPTPVEVNGRTTLVPAVPMIGAGTRILGTADSPVRMECCFVGSNAVIEAGSRIGFGCFILGRLERGVRLLPLTLCVGGRDGGPAAHRLGGVLGSLSSTILTHFIGWSFQAAGPDAAPAVAELVRQSIQHGIAAIEVERARRDSAVDSPSSTEDTSLACYTDEQLQSGLARYRDALSSGAWDIVHRDGRLHFASPKGRWEERDGAAVWRKG